MNKKWGFIDKTGILIIKPQFDEASSFSEGLARVLIGRNHGFIDKSGKMVIKPQFDLILLSRFSEGLAPVMIDGKWGFIKLPTCK
jgi:hypothetical protein